MQYTIGYLRFSSKVQAVGTSEVRQEGGFAEWLAQSGLPAWKEIYIDRGESGFKGYHRDGDFGRLLADCSRQLFPKGSVVWIEDMDRFSRQDLPTVLADFTTITRAGYSIRVGSLGQTFTAETEGYALMSVIFKSILARDESEKKSARGKKNWQFKRQAANGMTKRGTKTAACPSWMTPDGTGYQFNSKAETLRAACLLSIAGHGATEIRRRLGIDEAAKDWAGLVCMFRQKTLIGEYQPMTRTGKSERQEAGEAVEGYYPALLTKDEFYKLQASLDSRKTQKKRRGEYCTNLFTGLIHDSKGGAMVIKRQSRNNQAILAVLPGKRTAGATYKQADYDHVEKTLLGRFLSLTSADLYPVKATPSRLDAISGELADCENKIDRLTGLLLDQTGNGALVDALAALGQKKENLLAERETEFAKVANGKAVDSLGACQETIKFLAGLSGADLLDARRRLEALITRLVARITLWISGSKDVAYLVELTNGNVIQSDGADNRDEYRVA